MKSAAHHIISEKELENQKLQEQLQSVQEQLKEKEMALQKSQEKITELEHSKEKTWGADAGWGNQTGWGKTSGWSNSQINNVEEEKTW